MVGNTRVQLPGKKDITAKQDEATEHSFGRRTSHTATRSVHKKQTGRPTTAPSVPKSRTLPHLQNQNAMLGRLQMPAVRPMYHTPGSVRDVLKAGVPVGYDSPHASIQPVQPAAAFSPTVGSGLDQVLLAHGIVRTTDGSLHANSGILDDEPKPPKAASTSAALASVNCASAATAGSVPNGVANHVENDSAIRTEADDVGASTDASALAAMGDMTSVQARAAGPAAAGASMAAHTTSFSMAAQENSAGSQKAVESGPTTESTAASLAEGPALATTVSDISTTADDASAHKAQQTDKNTLLAQTPPRLMHELIRDLQLPREQFKNILALKDRHPFDAGHFFVRLNMSIQTGRYVGAQIVSIEGDEVHVRGLDSVGGIQRTRLQYVSNQALTQEEIVEVGTMLASGKIPDLTVDTARRCIERKIAALALIENSTYNSLPQAQAYPTDSSSYSSTAVTATAQPVGPYSMMQASPYSYPGYTPYGYMQMMPSAYYPMPTAYASAVSNDP